MVDAPDRATPRFPQEQVPRVARAVEAALDGWGVGPGTQVVCGGARGADILAAEAALARGARIRLCLALPPDEFERRSVALPGSDWVERFRGLLARAEVEVVSDVPDDDVFARANARIIEVARALDPEPRVLVVWNGQEGDGPGGTQDFVRRLGLTKPDSRLIVIDPTPRSYEWRQVAPGPKKILALDGGGIRGVLTLEALRSLEAQLRAQAGAEVVLSDVFDLIAGTSTGAIIAAALALGRSVDEVQDRYTALGRQVFQKRFWPLRFRSTYRDRELSRELDAFFGGGRTLGDPEFRSLLLVVLHNTVTDSPWPVSNCTQARYNRADRCLNELPDRNLDLPLTTLLRGSTAAPFYFPPQELRVGANAFVFQDGGVTPFNNPALLAFLVATLPEYQLCWPAGEEQLLVVSIGTGSAAASHPGLLARQVDAVFNARNLPSVFMRGASVGQDMLCRSIGRTRAGRPLDREFGARLGAVGVGGQSLFSYLRYDADLSDDRLREQGIRSPKLRRRLRKLDAVDALPQLRDLGVAVGREIDVQRDFRGFL
jgi:hypothetical protein